jgi:hypothetical protein
MFSKSSNNAKILKNETIFRTLFAVCGGAKQYLPQAAL